MAFFRRIAQLCCVSLFLFVVSVSNSERAGISESPESGWPEVIRNEGQQITVYPLQVESWKGDRLTGRAVVSVQNPASNLPTYGVIWLSARTETNPGDQRVTFDEVQIAKADFPSDPSLSSSTLKILREHGSEIMKPVSEESLKSNLVIEKAETATAHLPLRNGPPKIIMARSPTLLVLIDGAPVLRDTKTHGLVRVINTRALILYDLSKSRYFLYMGDRWMDAASLHGPWIQTSDPSPDLEDAKRTAVEQKQVDLLNDPNSPLMRQLNQHQVPRVYVSTEPAEIIETEGKPEFKSIPRTELLYVSNTDGAVFLDQRDQSYYVLLSGRWYRAKSLEGPWRYLAAKKLPKDFANIPETHRKGSVLASVPGTRQAKQAQLSNEVPQLAKVNRFQTSLTVQYDGPPEFKPIETTPLKYAINSKTPVIQTGEKAYSALQSGVWFQSNSPDGPWQVAARVPAVIYTIPPSSPLYYVTYVQVYDSTPDSVYVG